MKRLGVVIGLLCIFLLQGCDFFHRHPKEAVVAECYGNYIFESDLQGIVPENTSIMDSIHRVNAFIDSWIRRQVLLHQAEINLSKEDLDLGKELEEYRNSLIIYKYETQLIDQKLDTFVSDAEIEAYYEENKDNFQLHTTMVKAAYVILDADCRQRDMFQKLMSDRDTLLIQNLDVMANYYAVTSYLDIDNWIRLDELTKAVPIEIYNVESFLKKNKFVCFDWNDYICMVRFEDYLLEESLSPLDMVRDDICEVILTRRKMELLDRMKASVYNTALKNRDFEVYVGNPSFGNPNP
ncbi:MAG: hypothetical protein IJP44_06345 [Bacteroidales bacterium]|nr:hypothetical protein [Bacteroidales bacterium]